MFLALSTATSFTSPTSIEVAESKSLQTVGSGQEDPDSITDRSTFSCPATPHRSTAQGGANERDCPFCHVTTDSALMAHPQTGRMIKLTADEVAAMGWQFPSTSCKDHYEYLCARHSEKLRVTYADNAFAEYWHSEKSSKERQDKLITGVRKLGAFVALFVAGGVYMWFADPIGLRPYYADLLDPHRHDAQRRRQRIIQASGIEKP